MILLNDFKRQWKATVGDAVSTFEEVGCSGWYILGERVQSFEAALAKHWTMAYAAGVASGLDAIQIALRATHCMPGDRVLTTPLSAFATTLAIVNLGATPVFVDVDAFGLIDLDQVEQLLTNDATIRYLLPVHLFGHACDLDRLRNLQDSYSVTIIEDCAQSIGARWKEANTGTVGAAACTSFYPTKNLGALGDGGALLTNSKELDERARILRNYGQSGKYNHDVIGCNSRLDELHAAYLHRVGLPRLEAWTSRRKEIANTYLAGIESDFVKSVGRPLHSDSCWHLFPTLVEPNRKQQFRTHLLSKGIQSGEHYPLPIPDQRALDRIQVEIPFGLQKAREFCHSEVSIPIHPYLEEKDLSVVMEAINSWEG